MRETEIRIAWEQRLRRVDAQLAERALSPAAARERYRTLGREYVSRAAGLIEWSETEGATDDEPAER